MTQSDAASQTFVKEPGALAIVRFDCPHCDTHAVLPLYSFDFADPGAPIMCGNGHEPARLEPGFMRAVREDHPDRQKVIDRLEALKPFQRGDK